MIEYKVREKRDSGTNPYPKISYFTDEDEFVITQTIAKIVKDDNLNVLAYNICADHIHLLLVCEEGKMTKIVQKIKSITSKNCTQNRTREQASMPKDITREHAPLPHQNKTEHVPLPLWTQKFGCKEVVTQEHLFTAIDYIKHNRSKHNLPQHSKELQLLVENFVCDYDHAFREEYNGGFDVVIGNPPYGAKISDRHMEFIQRFTIGKSGNETYAFFYERALKLLNNKGRLGFITPDTWLRKDDFKNLRNYLLKNFTIEEIIETGPVFKDARDTWCLLIFIQNTICPDKHKIHHLQINRTVVSIEERQKFFEMNNWATDEFFQQSDWINKQGSVFGYLINEKQQEVIRGLMKLDRLGVNHNYLVSRGEEGSQSKFDNGIKSEFYMVKPEQVSKFHTSVGWCVNPNLLAVGKLEGLYIKPKIFVIRIQKMRWVQRIVASLDKRICSASLKTLQVIVHKDKNFAKLLVLEAILNSTLINFWCVNFLTDDINSSFLKKLPLPKKLKNNELSISVEKVKELIDVQIVLITKFQYYITSTFKLEKLSRMLMSWHRLEFGEFIKELNKAIKNERGALLTKKDEFEWLDLFEENKQKALNLKTDIDAIDKEIDSMVYELYGLTEEEIAIVENS